MSFSGEMGVKEGLEGFLILSIFSFNFKWQDIKNYEEYMPF